MPVDLSHITRDPTYHALLKKRCTLSRPLLFIMLLAYYGFILAIAFQPQWLSQKIGDGVATLGIVLGLGLIILTIGITAFFVVQVNRHVEPLVDVLHKTHGGKGV